jgi:alanine-synthesizing transaminase
VFSRRLDDAWLAGDNPLAAAERQRRQNHDALIDLTVSNPTGVDVDLPDRGAALAAALADPGIGRYHPSSLGPDDARALIAAEHARWGGAVAPAQIALSASSSESYAWLLKLLCDPGDVIVVPTPSYPLFDLLAGLEGVNLRHYHLAYAGHWQIDHASLAAALPGARAVVVVNPNNPTGSFITRSELATLTQLAAAHDAAVIVDEVFAPYAFARPPDAPATVTALSDLPALTFVLGGLSKAYGLPQLKLGWLAALGPPALVTAALTRLETIADTYLSVGTPVLRALPRLLALGAEIRADIEARVFENRRALAAAVAGTPVTWLPSEGGWSAILRMPAIVTDEAWALTLLQGDSVLVAPGYFFDLDHAGVGTTLVVSLLSPPAQFAAGIERIVKRAARLTP